MEFLSNLNTPRLMDNFELNAFYKSKLMSPEANKANGV